MTHFTPEEAVALRDEGSVDAAVIHPPGWEPSSTETAFKGVKDYPGRFAIMGSPPLDKPGSRYRIGSWRSRPGMLSCAFYTTRHAGFGTMANTNGCSPLPRRGALPLAVLATDSLNYLGGVAERHPALRLTIDYLGRRGGLTTLKDHAAMTHIPDLLALAKHRNIAVTVTGAPRYSAQASPLPDHAGLAAPDLRRVRPAPHVLGRRHQQDAMLVAAMRDDVHRAVARRSRQAAGHG